MNRAIFVRLPAPRPLPLLLRTYALRPGYVTPLRTRLQKRPLLTYAHLNPNQQKKATFFKPEVFYAFGVTLGLFALHDIVVAIRADGSRWMKKRWREKFEQRMHRKKHKEQTRSIPMVSRPVFRSAYAEEPKPEERERDVGSGGASSQGSGQSVPDVAEEASQEQLDDLKSYRRQNEELEEKLRNFDERLARDVRELRFDLPSEMRRAMEQFKTITEAYIQLLDALHPLLVDALAPGGLRVVRDEAFLAGTPIMDPEGRPVKVPDTCLVRIIDRDGRHRALILGMDITPYPWSEEEFETERKKRQEPELSTDIKPRWPDVARYAIMWLEAVAMYLEMTGRNSEKGVVLLFCGNGAFGLRMAMKEGFSTHTVGSSDLQASLVPLLNQIPLEDMEEVPLEQSYLLNS